ncbi:MAG: hypothetical protein HYZ51_04280 [Candidatus Doudnabacteria bacterium]|nr:hypothetical protein [Candidatus Doudnabacteria bacterium]
MRLGRIVILGILLWLFLLAEKYVFFELLGFAAPWQAWTYFLLIIIFVRIISGPLGVINFLEAIFAALVWLLLVVILDSAVAKRFLNPQIFQTSLYWYGFLAVLLSVFFLHRKRHIHIRKQLSAGHH